MNKNIEEAGCVVRGTAGFNYASPRVLFTLDIARLLVLSWSPEARIHELDFRSTRCSSRSRV